MKKFLGRLKQEPVTFLFLKMWKFGNGHRGQIVFYLSLSIIANLVAMVQPLIWSRALNELQLNNLGSHNINYILFMIFLIFLSDLVFWFFHGPSRIIENICAFKTQVNYRNFLLKGAIDLNLKWHNDKDSGDTIDKVNKAHDGLYSFSKHFFYVLGAIVKAIVTTFILFSFNFYIGIISLAILVLAFLIIFRFDVFLIPQYNKLNEYDNKISAKIYDALSNIVSVKALHIENQIYKNIHKAIITPFKLFSANKKLVEYKWFSGSMVFTLLVVLPLALYLYYNYKYSLGIQIGSLTALYLYLYRLNDVYYAFAGSYEEMIINKTRVKNAEPIENEIDKQQKTQRKKIGKWDSMKIKNLYFGYETETTGKYEISGIDIDIIRGERVAFIGESGSGKTTFLKVLHGLYENAKGEVLFDSSTKAIKTNFLNIDLGTTLVPQEPEVFSASIRENVTLGVDYKDDEIFKATNLAEFTQVVEALPNGLESIINEKGVNLSGGQKQRLALARALLFASDKEIILLDESTSSVDPENEVKIYKNIFSHFEGRTILASIHKMNLLKYFDRIVIFDAGKIVAEGTFTQLLETNSKFKNDWDEYILSHRGEGEMS
jgi:ATP-binding cassette subfamily B protein